MRLSDRSADIIALMHGAHASDHRLVAFTKSHAPGFHHSSWDAGSIDEVGLGAEQLRAQRYTRGWGVGQHALGSNYLCYAQDTWGSWAEYSHGIDFLPSPNFERAGVAKRRSCPNIAAVNLPNRWLLEFNFVWNPSASCASRCRAIPIVMPTLLWRPLQATIRPLRQGAI